MFLDHFGAPHLLSEEFNLRPAIDLAQALDKARSEIPAAFSATSTLAFDAISTNSEETIRHRFMPTDGGYDSDLYCGHEQDNFSSTSLEYDNKIESGITSDIQSATSPKPSPGASPAPNEEEYAKLQYQQDLGFRLDETLPRPAEAQAKRLAMEATAQPQQPRQGQRQVEVRIDKVISRAGHQAKHQDPSQAKDPAQDNKQLEQAEVTLRLQSPGRDDCRSSARSTSSPRSSTVQDPRAPETDVLLLEQLTIHPVLQMGECESPTRRDSRQGSDANPNDNVRTKRNQHPPPPTLHPDRVNPQRDLQLDDERHPNLGSSPLEQAQLLLDQRRETSSTTPITGSKLSQLIQPTSLRSQPVQRQTWQEPIVSIRHSDTSKTQSICEYADGDSGSASRRRTGSERISQSGIISTTAIIRKRSR
ncbi:hypothetical protein CROQUDRAFT_98876 [Cronartium quercuum f. sp. fusiforme G11]|uniref:Uncharacterized protein n=1 Tax=Cronartium quercuum f. sp. fusiforme G11 TaxID=708437 RepID=A0A9P6T6Y4_9BASI|nr:hypothetical protein CROQUDRAFT_98876 [Cronartium quercuum f. sp. fusiforme G11]